MSKADGNSTNHTFIPLCHVHASHTTNNMSDTNKQPDEGALVSRPKATDCGPTDIVQTLQIVPQYPKSAGSSLSKQFADNLPMSTTPIPGMITEQWRLTLFFGLTPSKGIP